MAENDLKERITRMRAWQAFETENLRASDLDAVLSAAEALADHDETTGTLNVEREKAAREYTSRNVGGMQPVVTVGDRVHAAFVSGAEWEADQGKPQITDEMVERAMEHRGFVTSADCTCGHKAKTTRAHLRHVLEAALEGGE